MTAILTVGFKCNILYVTRRNLLALLSKLDRNVATPGASQCTLIKQDTVHPKYPASAVTELVALEDAEYYTDRAAGDVWPDDKTRYDACRAAFEKHINDLHDSGELSDNTWVRFERANSGHGKHGDGKGTILDGYLDLYIQHRWSTRKACWYLVQESDVCACGPKDAKVCSDNPAIAPSYCRTNAIAGDTNKRGLK